MKHVEKNQLFIESINHWTVDGVELFLDGFEPLKLSEKYINGWVYLYNINNTKEFKLNGSHCPLCVNFCDDCSKCFMVGVPHLCCVSYRKFILNPNLITCEAVITELWDTAQNTMHSNYKDKFYSECVIKNLKKGILKGDIK